MNRPSSSHSVRAPSSLSRPSSSASQRTISRVSHRPASRLSQRPPTRQSIRVAPMIQALVTSITGYTDESDEQDYNDAVDLVSKKIDAFSKQGLGTDMKAVEAHMNRLSKKARIQSHDRLAEALQQSSSRLRDELSRLTDLDSEVTTSKLPDHLQFLLAISSPPNDATISYADNYVERLRNPPKDLGGLTWKDILAEEPLEGQHWEGAYGLPPGSVAPRWKAEPTHDLDSPVLSPLSLSDDDDFNDSFSTDLSVETSEASLPLTTPPPIVGAGREIASERATRTLELRTQLETLQGRQYWRNDWRIDTKVGRPFDISDVSTLGSTIERNLDCSPETYLASATHKYINEHDIVREVLLGLQGHANLVLVAARDDHGRFQGISLSCEAPKLLHLSKTAQASILTSFARHATIFAHLRLFSETVFSSITQFSVTSRTRHLPRTLEAFCEAVDTQLRSISTWCAGREETILRASSHSSAVVVSLLELEKALRDKFSDVFPVLLDALQSSFSGLTTPFDDYAALLKDTTSSPSEFSSRLLDSLFLATQTRQSFGDTTTATALMQVFIHTVEPTWGMLSRWLSNGIFETDRLHEVENGAFVESEFFIESNGLPLADAEFWSDGCAIRTTSLLQSSMSGQNSNVPMFLRSIASSILSAGKSVGLLRILDQGTALAEHLTNDGIEKLPPFKTFMHDVVGISLMGYAGSNTSGSRARIFSSMTIEDLSLVVCERLLPRCQAVEKSLLDTIFNECEFWKHLHSVEGLLLMRKGDCMTDFCNVLFSRVDEKKLWTDLHFLNNAFRDIVDFGDNKWIDSSLVRLSYKVNKETTHTTTVRNLTGLSLEYGAPFPLYYILDRRCMEVYNSVFILLIQLRRAKSALDNVFVRNGDTNRTANELKVFYATRGRLSWFVNTMSTFVGSHAIQVEVLRFHNELKNTKSLDDVIQLHRDHLERIELGCLLHSKATTLRKAIISILDMCMVFSRVFASFAGDTSLNLSSVTISVSRRHRSRRIRRQNRNIVSLQPIVLDESDGSDSDMDEPSIPDEGSFVLDDLSFSEGDESLLTRIDKMSEELDGLVRFVRRSVEGFASSSGSNCSAFEILAFALQDWDL